MSPKGTEDLVLVPATTVHINAFITWWVAIYLARKAKDPLWNYRLFMWDQVIGYSVFKTMAAVDANGVLEGLLATSKQKTYVKVEFIATAPWNHGDGRRRRGVGAGMISSAIAYSLAEGLHGELVLHSTPESESFYERMTFERTGQRDAEGLAIFKLSQERAAWVIKAYPQIVLRR